MLKVSGSCWRDHHGVVHILLDSYETVCTRRYRLRDTRSTDVAPTCLQCIAEEDFMVRYLNGEAC